MSFPLPPLPYALNALEPYISKTTFELHYGKHHRAYADKLESLTRETRFADMSLEDVMRETYGRQETTGIFNNAAQHWNHSFFWSCMKPGGSTQPARLQDELSRSFGNPDAFKQSFIGSGLVQFGSGWVWLVAATDGKLKVISTSNADNPLLQGAKPLLVCDVWEHAYYVDYQNRRGDFLTSFFDHLVDWDGVLSRLLSK